MDELYALHPAHGAATLQPVSWIVALAIVFSLGLAGAMGANDVSNAFATSVGSGVLSLRAAVVVAAVFNFAGSISLGAEVSKTIAGNIVDVNAFVASPEKYMLGMFTSLLSGASTVALATVFGLPVSTTHAIIGAIAGFALVEHGSAVHWYPDMLQIIVSWVSSPVLAGVVSGSMYYATRRLVLQEHDLALALERQKKLVAIVVGFTLALLTLFVGLRKSQRGSRYDYIVPILATLVFVVFGFLAYRYLVPLMLSSRPYKLEIFPLLSESDADGISVGSPAAAVESTSLDNSTAIEIAAQHQRWTTKSPADSPFAGDLSRPERGDDGVTYGENTPGTQTEGQATLKLSTGSSGKATRQNGLRAVADHHDETLEKNFHMVQIMTACYMSFAHGAGDVSNAAGPLVAIWAAYSAGAVNKDIDPQTWIIVLGGLGICAGMLFFGKRVIETMGKKLTRITASRGFCVELGTATTVMLTSFIGIPISSTHCAVGSIIAIGLVNSAGAKAVEWRLAGRVVVSWVLTLVIAGCLGAALYAAMRPAVEGLQPPSGDAQLVWCVGNCTVLR